MSTHTEIDDLLAEAAAAIREVDSAACAVLPRVLRRVIKQDHELPGLGFQVPHRKCYVISRERLLWLVAKDELGLKADDQYPPKAILLAAPGEQRLAEMDLAGVLSHYWRLLFHARVHLAMEEHLANGRLTPASIRERIDRIGQAEFDEVQSVLRREHFLLHPNDYQQTYVEFAAVYLELRFFAPTWLPAYFPSLDDLERIDGILADDVAGSVLFEATRPFGAGSTLPLTSPMLETSKTAWQVEERIAAESEPHLPTYRKLLLRADRVSERGNSVRAAILRMRAARYATGDRVAETSAGALREIEQLVLRLQTALAFDDDEFAIWCTALTGLLANSTRGFWNADRRLLYDLQKVCVDHEREIYVVDLIAWATSFGRRPIRRPLPNQREVLMSKHLRSATRRLSTVRLSGRDRQRLSALLHRAAHSAEDQLRLHLRPLATQALTDVELVPRNLPERVAFRKLIEELLDVVVSRGFLSMGDFRDAISRNNLKLNDLGGPVELVTGDRLMRADRRLGTVLDGVYRRGEFYLRLLQGLSSLSFGTRVGRFMTQYIVIPFAGAFVILEGLHHLLDKIFGQAPDALNPIMSPLSLVALGGFLIGVIHVPAFRQVIVDILKAFFNLVHGIVVDAPHWLINVTLIRQVLRSLPVVLFRRFVLNSLILTSLVYFLLNVSDSHRAPNQSETVALFLALALILNSRLGRNIEEISAELAVRTWHKIRAHVFVALFELVMDVFKQILEGIERVLYAVDEWLRFKSGETRFTLIFKAVLGVAWSAVTFVVRLCVNLLIEPQINPIKHFPVVTVSHKILLPSLPFLIQLLSNPLDPVVAKTVATTVVFLLPGVFGFLVWELKENWRLYEANRSSHLKPAIVGDHGETLIRILKPGLHSGTVPKLFAKLRRAERRSALTPRYKSLRARLLGKLEHTEAAVRRFVEREFLTMLAESERCESLAISVGEIKLASNSLRIELCCPALSEQSLWLAFQEQSGWMVTSIMNHGWLSQLESRQTQAVWVALAGLYKLSGADLVREQIEACFEPLTVAYDVGERGLVVWPDPGFETEVRYDLQQRPILSPRPRLAAKAYDLPRMEPEDLIFGLSKIEWDVWVEVWESDLTDEYIVRLLPPQVRLLPDTQRLPIAELH